MAKKRIPWLVVAAIGIVAVSLPWVLPKLQGRARKAQQEQLATNLGVSIDDYPYQGDFPAGYFYRVLKPGMTYEEVHHMVREYESVYRCFGTDEIYYYFSKNDDDALRFALYYDEEGRYVELQGEDPNSRTLSLGGCSPGLLGRQ